MRGKNAPGRRVVYLRFPDELTTAKILELLLPFSQGQKRLILDVVEANTREYPTPHSKKPQEAAHFRAVHLSGTNGEAESRDPLEEFLKACCKQGKGLRVAMGDLEIAYKAWCQRNRESYPLSRPTFRERLIFRGVKASRLLLKGELGRKVTRSWIGIALKKGATK